MRVPRVLGSIGGSPPGHPHARGLPPLPGLYGGPPLAGPDPRRSLRRTVLVLAILATGWIAFGGVTGSGGPSPAEPPAAVSATGANRLAASRGDGPALVLAPAPNARDVSVLDPVTVAARQSTLVDVTLVDGAGRHLAGGYDAGRTGWHSTAPLAYDTRYTLDAVASVTADPGGAAPGTSPPGTRLHSVSSFRTVRPANLTMPYLRANAAMLLSDRTSYGIGQPIVVSFDESIPDRAAAQRTLQVSTDPPVDGAWHWFNDHEAHWRPQQYWRPGTRVTVTARVYGVNLGRNLYGQSDATASFTIGPSHIAIADDTTFHIKVYIDGNLARDIPTAMGLHTTLRTPKGQLIDLRTHSGVHVVLGHEQVTRMTSASYGLTGPGSYDEPVYWTTHISYSGEYVHAAPWSVAQQGNSDASHGCLNVNTDNAIWFYNTFIPGDIVDVRHTGLQLDPMDGLGDWNIDWAAWVRGSALPYLPAPRTGRAS